MSKKIETYEKFKWMLFNKKIKLISTEEEYNQKIKLKIKCLKCGNIFETNIFEYQYINCNCEKRKKSYKLKELIKWLNSFNIFMIENDNTLLIDNEIDIFLPEYRIAIDFDDLYWHSELYIPKMYHIDKTNKCKEKNVQLLHIFENEWENKQEIVKSIILSKLGLYERRFYARKCELKELSNEEYREFVINYHLQGYAPASYRVGLFYNGELLQICSIGKNRFKKNEMELVRHCSKKGIQVIGGFSRLMDYYYFNNLVTYVDLRYSNGNGYFNSGWKMIEQTKPNYWYWNKKDMNIDNRIKYQKHKLEKKLKKYDPNLSEVENMYNNGFTRIWDCGNIKMKLER